MALLDVQVAALGNQSQNYLATGRSPGRQGNAHVNIVPYQVFSAQDMDFIIACGNDSQFVDLCEAIGLPELYKDPRFTRNPDRIRHREAIVSLLAEHFRGDTADNWVRRIHARKVPVGLINDIGGALAEPQVLARDMLIDIPHALNPEFRMVGSPIKLSATPVEYRLPPPRLGEHTDEVLRRQLGLNEARLAELKAQGVIAQLADD